MKQKIILMKILITNDFPKKNQKKGHIKTDFCDIKEYLGI